MGAAPRVSSLAALCFACAAVEPPPSAPAIASVVLIAPVAEPPEPPARDLPASADDSAENMPFTIPVPDKVACQFDEPNAGGRQIALGLRAHGALFGRVSATTVTARVAVAASELIVDVSTRGLLLRAFAIEGSLPLHAVKPIAFDGFVAPLSAAALGVVSGRDGGIDTQLELPEEIALPKRAPLIATVPCAGLALSAKTFDPSPLFGDEISTAYLTKLPTPLARSVDGATVATLHAKDTPQVSVLETKGKRSKIAWWLGDVVAFGWVDSARLRRAPPNDDLFGTGGLGLSGMGEGCCARQIVCKSNVPLRAEVSGTTAVIGVVLPGTMIVILNERATAFEVELPGTTLSKAEQASLVIDKTHTASCVEN